MITFSDFEAEVLSALLNLNDPTHPPGQALVRVLRTNRADELRALLMAAIESLRPDATMPTAARAHRLYELLRYRFVEELPQQECSRRLGLSSRHLRREQQSAIHLLAERLWPQGVNMGEMEPAADAPVSTWRSQLQQEFSALQQHTPSELSDLAKVIHDAVALHKVLGVHPQVQVRVGDLQEGATAAIHPAVLGQIVFVGIDRLASNGITREIVLSASSQRPWTRIAIESRPASPEFLPASDFIAETLSVHGGRVTTRYAAGWASIEVLLATREKSIVLVVDDNVDLVHFYKRYVEGTGYEVVHVSQGGEVWSAVARRTPDLIVLDVMLPDINGWQLLHELQQHPATAQIPVIVCSVINQEALAKTLGAAAYLAKPVHRQAFIQLLDQVRLSR
ncbi:MAG: response regulator [Caldilineaceae bacterium]|nr:response regulator [Caldilineaceae bacterium]